MSKTLRRRRRQIEEMLSKEKEIHTKDFAQRLQVSEETIRKDLLEMEKLGLLRRQHGKACKVDTYQELSLDLKASENAHIKQVLARYALAYIEDNQTIYLDPSTTNLFVAKFLHLKKGLTLITNSLAIALDLSKSDHKIIVLGGKLSNKSKAMNGAYTNQMLETIQIDLAIMGSDGFKGVDGPTTFSYEQLDFKQKMMQCAKKKILLCDCSKFTKQACYRYALFSDFDTIITNKEDISKQVGMVRNKHLKIIKT